MTVLLRSRVDSAPLLVRRQGRFSLEKEVAASPRHFFAAVADQQERMIMGMEMQGFEYVDDYQWDVTGPFNHIEFADSAEADPGPMARPDPRDVEGFARWDAAEKARVAKRLDAEKNLQDFVIIGTFRHKGPVQYGSLAAGRRWKK